MWNCQIKVTQFKLVIIMNLSFNQSAVYIDRYLRAIANQKNKSQDKGILFSKVGLAKLFSCISSH